MIFSPKMYVTDFEKKEFYDIDKECGMLPRRLKNLNTNNVLIFMRICINGYSRYLIA